MYVYSTSASPPGCINIFWYLILLLHCMWRENITVQRTDNTSILNLYFWYSDLIWMDKIIETAAQTTSANTTRLLNKHVTCLPASFKRTHLRLITSCTTTASLSIWSQTLNFQNKTAGADSDSSKTKSEMLTINRQIMKWFNYVDTQPQKKHTNKGQMTNTIWVSQQHQAGRTLHLWKVFV